MKRILILALCLILALGACGTQPDGPASDGDDQTDLPLSESETVNTPGEERNGAPEENAGGEILVAYVSCTGNTRGLAEKIASALDADLYEIVPEQPYSDADLNYNDSSTRATVEQNDPDARPAISGSVDNMDGYDTVIIGYPIWWGQAPKILYTFMESYDFSGKTVAAFCTSGSSGVGSSATSLHSSAPDANWIDGTRFSSNASNDDIENWLSNLGLK